VALRECKSRGCSGAGGQLTFAEGSSPIHLQGLLPITRSGDTLFLEVGAKETGAALRGAADQDFAVRGILRS
jgi:hypothetical protein